MPSDKRPCWNKEKGSKIIKPDDGRDTVSCDVRVPKNGEGKVDEGNTAKPKVFCEDVLATSLSQTPKQSCEPQARPAAARCMMVKRGNGRGSPRCPSTPKSGSNRTRASSRRRRKRHQDTECRQNRSSHEALQNRSDVASWEWTQHGKCWRAVESGTRRHEERGRGHPGVIPRTLADVRASQESQRRGRMSAEALSRQAT